MGRMQLNATKFRFKEGRLKKASFGLFGYPESEGEDDV